MQKYIYQGKEYARLEDMPAEARAVFERVLADNNADGKPDLFEQLGLDEDVFNGPFKTSEEYIINGEKYASLDEMPEDVRRHMQKFVDAKSLHDKLETAREMSSSAEVIEEKTDDEIFFDKLVNTPAGPAREQLIEQEKTKRRYKKFSLQRTQTVTTGDGSGPATAAKILIGSALLGLAFWWFFFSY